MLQALGRHYMQLHALAMDVSTERWEYVLYTREGGQSSLLAGRRLHPRQVTQANVNSYALRRQVVTEGWERERGVGRLMVTLE